MLAQNPPAHDPLKMVRLEAVRGLFLKNARVAPGEFFEVAAKDADGMLVTGRAKFADNADRHLVYKRVEHFL